MRIEVYWNLHKRLYSVRALEGEWKGRVISHTRQIFIYSPSFVVQKSGQQKARKQKQRNVHAFVRGFTEEGSEFFEGESVHVRYNPFRDNFFIRSDTGDPIHQCRAIDMSINKSGWPVVRAIGITGPSKELE